MIKPRNLQALYNRPTCYEAALFDKSGRMLQRLGFSARRTKRALFDYAYGVRAFLLDDTKAETDFAWRDGAWCTPNYSVAWSGRTERDCASLDLERAA